MKHPTLQKVMLTTMALVASLALSAQAGRPKLTTAKQHHGSGSIILMPSAKASGSNAPASTYTLDDGTAEDAIGLIGGGDIIALNGFTVIPGSETITSVDIAWGTPIFFDPSLDGKPYTVAVWSDPNGDGNPTDAVLLTTAGGVISAQGTNTFISTPVNVVIPTAKFFVGVVITHNDGQFPCAFDETAPTFSNRSYVAGNAAGAGDINNLNNNSFLGTIESFGLVGNWLIRADSNGNGTPTPTPTPTPPMDARWYNGDFNDVNGLANEQDTSLGAGQFASVYDDFIVGDPSGWDVTSVFSNNLSSTNVTGANWEIRQGISEGVPGNVVASGTTLTPTVTLTGRSGFGFTEYMVAVTGLNVHLAPGTYFLNVTPIGDLSGRSFDSTTSGANAVGMPPGNNQNAFFNSPFFGAFFTSTANFGQPYDFSMGVNGSVTGGGGALTLNSAASRKAHGPKGNFDISLPLSGSPGVECRTGLQKMVVVMTFNNNVTGADSASVNCGSGVGAVSVDSGNAHNLLVSYNGTTCNGSTVTATANNVHDDQGNTLASASASMLILTGDVTGNGSVTNGDITTVKAALGQQTNSSNFRDDVTLDGKVTNQDLQTVKANR